MDQESTIAKHFLEVKNSQLKVKKNHLQPKHLAIQILKEKAQC